MVTANDSAELQVYRRYPLDIVSGSGVELTTADGRTLLDLYGGHATALLGYDHPKLVMTLAEQAHTLFFQTNAVELAVRERAARALVDQAPGLDRAFFVNSGAEANENALRVACGATKRSRVVAFEGGFHGRTAAAAACTDGSDKWYGFARTPFDVTFVPRDDLPSILTSIDETVAAVIVEPVQGMAGAVPIASSILRAVRERTRATGTLVIADEVQCGMGRSGDVFASNASDMEPDLLTVAKGIAGGFPCGALLVSEAVAGAISLGDLGTTFGGGPMACALIEATMAELTTPGFLDRIPALEHEVRQRCVGDVVTAVQGRGLLLGLRCSVPAKGVVSALLEEGILVGGAADPHIVRLLPPLTIESEHIARLAEALRTVATRNLSRA